MNAKVAFITIALCVIQFFVVGDLNTFFYMNHIMKHMLEEQTTNKTDEEINTLLYFTNGATTALFVSVQCVLGGVIWYAPCKCTRDSSFLVFARLGVVLWFIGVFVSTYTTEVSAMFSVDVLFSGVGGSLVYWSTVVVIMHVGSYGIPLTLALVSGGIGQVVFNKIAADTYTFEMSEFDNMDVYMWQRSIRIVSIIGLILMMFAVNVVGDLISKKVDRYADPNLDKELYEENAKQVRLYVVTKARMIFHSSSFTAFVCSIFFSSFTSNILSTQLVPYMNKIGDFDSASTMDALFVSGMYGKLVSMALSGCFSRGNSLVPCALYALNLIGVLLALATWVNENGDHTKVVFFVSVYGFCSGGINALMFVIVADYASGRFADQVWDNVVEISSVVFVPITTIGMLEGGLFGVIIFDQLVLWAGYVGAILFLFYIQGIAVMCIMWMLLERRIEVLAPDSTTACTV